MNNTHKETHTCILTHTYAHTHAHIHTYTFTHSFPWISIQFTLVIKTHLHIQKHTLFFFLHSSHSHHLQGGSRISPHQCCRCGTRWLVSTLAVHFCLIKKIYIVQLFLLNIYADIFIYQTRSNHFEAAIIFIHEARAKGGVVLVHW